MYLFLYYYLFRYKNPDTGQYCSTTTPKYLLGRKALVEQLNLEQEGM